MKISKTNVAAAAGLMALLVGDSREAALKQSVELKSLTDPNWPLGLNVNPGPRDVFVRCYQNYPEEMIINLTKSLPCNNTKHQVSYNSTLHYKGTWIYLATNLSKAYQEPDPVTPSITTTLAPALDISSTGSTGGASTEGRPLVSTGNGSNTPFMVSVLFWLIVLSVVVVAGAAYVRYLRPRYEREAYQGMQENIQGWYEVIRGRFEQIQDLAALYSTQLRNGDVWNRFVDYFLYGGPGHHMVTRLLQELSNAVALRVGLRTQPVRELMQASAAKQETEPQIKRETESTGSGDEKISIHSYYSTKGADGSMPSGSKSSEQSTEPTAPQSYTIATAHPSQATQAGDSQVHVVEYRCNIA